jgi:hypothetical protein
MARAAPAMNSNVSGLKTTPSGGEWPAHELLIVNCQSSTAPAQRARARTSARWEKKSRTVNTA